MRHTSIKLNAPIEIVNTTSMNPLISKCEIKVCYVGEEPNRNGTIITKELAVELAQSLPGSPIVGFYDEELGDFLGHERELSFDEDGNLFFKEITRPYGFIDSQAKVWFQKFLDDGRNEREYLMTEGYLWTGQYPECQRVIERGNNQSMELDPKKTSMTRTNLDNDKQVFFIINEAILSKLCILGENTEPCFEGATITSPQFQFSFEEDFKNKLFSMINELKELVKGGEEMSEVILENEIVEETVETEVEVVEETVETEEIVGNDDQSDLNNFEENTEEEEDEEEEEKCPHCGKPLSECICEKYEALQQDYEALRTNFSALEEEVVSLREYKAAIVLKEKEAMINSFYMLSDEDKADVITNIDNYSLEDIEAKLSVICVRNKVSFNLEEDTSEEETSYTLSEQTEDLTPAWVKAVRSVRDQKN